MLEVAEDCVQLKTLALVEATDQRTISLSYKSTIRNNLTLRLRDVFCRKGKSNYLIGEV